ncbi:hypothetical protein ACHAXA_007875 [Cyclostephanos tholiformis]|uniref:Uncharacterized protein n=1 Tax=Cyclostephanos tholiformis TaxID=382380 RepID=A0ABD3RG72_9STRA
MNQLPQASQRWSFRHYAKSPGMILVEISRKLRGLDLCRGGDWQEDEVIATDYKFRPSHKHNMLQAKTWGELLLELDDILSVSRAIEDEHPDGDLVIVASSSANVEVHPVTELPDNEDPSDVQIESPPRIIRMTYCFDRNDGRERRIRFIDKVARRQDPYECKKDNCFIVIDSCETSSLEETSSLNTSLLEYSDDDDDDDNDGNIKLEHWC